MEKTINVSKINFAPIEIAMTIKITSINELQEFITFDNNGAPVVDCEGIELNNLTDLLTEICSQITTQL